MGVIFFDDDRLNREYGRFWMAFNALELILRVFLARKQGLGTAEIERFLEGKLGESVPDCPMTDYRSFSKLCLDYNGCVALVDQIDFSSILSLRDAMAHGRVTAKSAESGLYVIKYDSPRDGSTIVSYRQELTPAFMRNMVSRIEKAAKSITNEMNKYMKA